MAAPEREKAGFGVVTAAVETRVDDGGVEEFGGGSGESALAIELLSFFVKDLIGTLLDFSQCRRSSKGNFTIEFVTTDVSTDEKSEDHIFFFLFGL